MFIKKNEFEKLKQELRKQNEKINEIKSDLTYKIDLLKFKQENPCGMKLDYVFIGFKSCNVLKYTKQDQIKELILKTYNSNDCSKYFELDKNNHIIEEDFIKGCRTEYKFDIDKEILIQLKQTKLGKETKKGNKKNDK